MNEINKITEHLCEIDTTLTNYKQNFYLYTVQIVNYALTQASRNGNTIEVQRLLNADADPNATDPHHYNFTSLHWASENGHSEVVSLLLSRRADPNALEYEGYSPLDIANSSPIRKILATHGALLSRPIDENYKKRTCREFHVLDFV